MPTFIIRPIPRELTTAVRSTLRAPGYGHPVHREVARGTGPCRECLSAFQVQREERLLFTHDPFAGAERLSQPGPVFVHAEPCEPFSGDGYPQGLTELPVVAEAFLRDGARATPRAIVAGREAEILHDLLADSAVEFVHLRHGEAGCFIARVDRASD